MGLSHLPEWTRTDRHSGIHLALTRQNRSKRPQENVPPVSTLGSGGTRYYMPISIGLLLVQRPPISEGQPALVILPVPVPDAS